MSLRSPANLTSALAVDGLLPSSVAMPESVDELAAALAPANERDAAVVPWGGGRHMSLGNVPSRYDIALRTTKLDRLLEYEPADLTVTVEAGITMGKVQQMLAEHGQFLPIDAPADATAGGVLAAGVSGPSRHAYGLPRDWLLGCRIALADGTVIKAGGRVVKNVAGYDMPKLAVGALGTLGVIVEATFKLAPLPPAQETLLASFPTLEAAAEALFAADERSLALRAVALRSFGAAQDRQAQDDALAAFWLAGPQAAVERTARELRDLTRGGKAQRLEGQQSEAWWAVLTEQKQLDGSHVALKASLQPSAVVGFMQQLASLGRDAAVAVATLTYPTTGLVLADLGAADAERLAAVIEQARAAAVAAGGALVVLDAPVAVKQRVDVWGETEALPLMRRLKEQFDPRGTLSPGRFVGGI